jgi:hypothetical protein
MRLSLLRDRELEAGPLIQGVEGDPRFRGQEIRDVGVSAFRNRPSCRSMPEPVVEESATSE